MNNVESTCEQQGFEILHSVANRVRLRALDTKTKDKLTAIAQHLRTTAGIESVRINQDTGSLLITYDQNLMSRAQVQQLFEPYGVTQETSSPERLGPDSYTQTFKRLTSFIPPVVGLATVRGLGIVGWQGFAAYIVASRVTREVMNQFDRPSSSLSEKKSQQQSEAKPVLGIAGIETTQSNKSDESDYRVIHQIPGRIRLSSKRLKQDLDYAKKLENLTQWDNRITSVRVNPEAGSVVISYRVGKPSTTGKIPLDSSEIIALMELIALDEAQPKKETHLKENLTSQTVILQETEELSAKADVQIPEDVKQQEGSEKLENVTEKTESDSPNLLVSETVSEKTEKNSQPLSETEKPIDDSEQQLSSTHEQPEASSVPQSEESSNQETIKPIVKTEPDYQKFELSEDESGSPWRRFKACMLTTMLKLMVNFPLQQA